MLDEVDMSIFCKCFAGPKGVCAFALREMVRAFASYNQKEGERGGSDNNEQVIYGMKMVHEAKREESVQWSHQCKLKGTCFYELSIKAL